MSGNNQITGKSAYLKFRGNLLGSTAIVAFVAVGLAVGASQNNKVHAADISNPVLPNFDVVKQWANMITVEFSNQCNSEKELGLPFAPFMDGLDNDVAIAKLQVGFLTYVVGPLWKAIGEMDEGVANCFSNLQANRDKWKELSCSV